MLKKRLVLMICSVFYFCSAAAAEEIRVEGGGAATSAIFSMITEAYEDATSDKLVVTKSTPVKGLISLEKGLVDIATAAVPLEDMIKGAGKEGITIDPATLRSSAIAQNRTIVFIHKSNLVNALSKDQLKGIFTGKITNWREVGGNDLPIVVIWGGKTPGQNALFTKLILDGEPVTAKAIAATDYANIRAVVSKSPGGVGIDPHGLRSAAIKVPVTPPVISPIIVITKGAPSVKVQKLLDFVAATLDEIERK